MNDRIQEITRRHRFRENEELGVLIWRYLAAGYDQVRVDAAVVAARPEAGRLPETVDEWLMRLAAGAGIASGYRAGEDVFVFWRTGHGDEP